MSDLQNFAQRYIFKRLSIDEIKIDYTYQRDEKELATIIGKEFNEEACTPIIVAKRVSGLYYVIDGQQRKFGAEYAGYKNIWCCLLNSSGRQFEAALFKKLNGARLKVSERELFRAALVSKEKYALSINTIIQAAGFELNLKGQKAEWPLLGCFKTLMFIYGRGDEVGLTETLGLIYSCWPGQLRGLNETYLKGLYLFLESWKQSDKSFNYSQAIKKFSSKTAQQVTGEFDKIWSRHRITDGGCSKYTSAAEYFGVLYRSRAQREKKS